MSLSIPLRNYIEASVARMQLKLPIANQLLAQGANAAQLAPSEASLAHLRNLRQTVNQKLIEWTAIIGQLSPDERMEEQDIFDGFKVDDCSPTEWVVFLEEKIVDL